MPEHIDDTPEWAREEGPVETQMAMLLPERDTDEILRDRLEAAVAEFNAEQDSARRVELHGEMQRLRAILRGAGNTT